MKSIGSTGAQWRASLRQPNNRMSSISKRLAALNQRGVGPNRRTFVFYGSKNKTPGSYRHQNSCDFASLGASLKSEVTPCRASDSIFKVVKRQSTKIKKGDFSARKLSVDLIGISPPTIQEMEKVSPDVVVSPSRPHPHPHPYQLGNAPLDDDQNIPDRFVNTRKFLENYGEIVFCCNLSPARGLDAENVENVVVDSQAQPAARIENIERTISESMVVENECTSTEYESPRNEMPLNVEAIAATTNSAPKSINVAPVPAVQNSTLEETAMSTVSIKNPTDQILSSPQQVLTATVEKPTKGKTVPRKRRSGRRTEKTKIFQTDPQEDDSSHVRYRKLFYCDREHKWVEHLILEEEEAEDGTTSKSKSKDEDAKFVLPHLVKGRQTNRFKEWLPTAFIKNEKNKCFYDKIHVTDELRMELHKRKMPVVGSYFQEHIFKFGKLPFRGNPRPI